MNSPVTLWLRRDVVHGWRHNHLSDGHETGKRPQPNCPEQTAPWARGEWQRYHAWLAGNKVVGYA